MVVAVRFDVGDLTERAAIEEALFGFNEMRRATALRADLHNPAILAGGGDHGLAFHDIDADRLLHVHVAAGLGGLDHGERVPMIGRGDEADVEVLLLQHLAVVAVGSRLLFRRLTLGNNVGRGGNHVLIHIAERDHFHGRDLDETEQIRLAIPPRTDQPDPLGLGAALCEKAGAGGGEKRSAIHGSQCMLAAAE